jgi:bifunctional DNase/RNase
MSELGSSDNSAETEPTEVAPAVPAPAPTEVAPTPLELLALSPEEWRIVAVASVEMDLPGTNPEVVLHEAQDPWRELRIPVGLPEGTAIAYAFRGIDTPRPLTHEMVTEVLDRHDVSIEAVRITVRRGQLFFAEIDTMGPRGRRVVPCRPSDAIALALRQRLPTPILVAEWVFTGADAPAGIAGADAIDTTTTAATSATTAATTGEESSA